MVSHIIEVRTKPGAASALCTAIRDQLIPEVIQPYRGFVSEIVMIAHDDPNHITAISFWDSKENADAFYADGFARVSTALAPYMAAKPERRDCEVFEWSKPMAHEFWSTMRNRA